MKRVASVAALLFVLLFVATAQAAEDPTGTWTWKTERNGQSRESTLKLKLEGDKLTGAMVGRNNAETAISDATYKDGELSFNVTREFNGNKFTMKYSGKITGDSIKGKMESERNGEKLSRDWEAKRSK